MSDKFWNCDAYRFLAGSTAGGCDKVGRENGAKECPDGGTHHSTYDAVILEKGERSRAVRSYSGVTRGDVETPLGENRLIISYIIYFIQVYLHRVTMGPRWLHPLSQRHGRPLRDQLSQHNLGNYYTTSRTPWKNGEVRREELGEGAVRREQKKEEDSVAVTPFVENISLGRVKHSTRYRSGSTAGKGTRGDDFWNSYE